MIKNEHHVLFWEHGQHANHLIPICEPTPLQEEEDDGSRDVRNQRSSKRTYNCVALGSHPEPGPRECRKLLKRGCTWSLCGENNTNTEEATLDHLLYYRIVIEDTRRVRHRDRKQYNYYFKRSRQLKRLCDSCYIADDRCIVLLKYKSPSLKICYLDILNPAKTYFQKLVLLHSGLQMRLCNGALWIVPSPTLTQIEVLYMRPNVTFLNCTIIRHNLSLKYSTLTAFFSEAQCSSDCIFFLKKKKYLAYDSVKHCLIERNIDIPELNELEDFHVVGKMFFAVQIREDKKTEPPVFFTGVVNPVMRITRRIDLSRSLGQYQSYVPGYTDITTHHRGMKALIMSTESYIVVLDLLTGKVSQILSYIPCFWQHQLSIQFSLDGNVIKLLGKYKFTGKTEYLCVNFRTWHGTSLKEMCLRCVSKHFTYDELQRRKLPRSLLRELEDAYRLKDDIIKL